jgi:hypothetical protein
MSRKTNPNWRIFFPQLQTQPHAHSPTTPHMHLHRTTAPHTPTKAHTASHTQPDTHPPRPTHTAPHTANIIQLHTHVSQYMSKFLHLCHVHNCVLSAQLVSFSQDHKYWVFGQEPAQHGPASALRGVFASSRSAQSGHAASKIFISISPAGAGARARFTQMLEQMEFWLNPPQALVWCGSFQSHPQEAKPPRMLCQHVSVEGCS